MVNNVLSMKFDLFCVENLTKPVTATSVVNRDKSATFCKFFFCFAVRSKEVWTNRVHMNKVLLYLKNKNIITHSLCADVRIVNFLLKIL